MILSFLSHYRKSHSKQSGDAVNRESSKHDSSNIKPVSKKKPKPDKVTSEENLNSYILESEKIKLNRYKCSICNILKSGFENFLSHKLKHAGVVPFHCKICTKGFYRKSDWKRHELKASCHKRSTLNVSLSTILQGRKIEAFVKSSEIQQIDSKTCYKCSICDRRIASYDTFLAHKFDHAGIRPFVCQMCDKSFTRVYEFKRHITTSLCAELYEEFERTGKIDLISAETDNANEAEEKLPDINSLLRQVEEFEGRLEKRKGLSEENIGEDSFEASQEHNSESATTDETESRIKSRPGNKTESIQKSIYESIQEKLVLAINILNTASHEQLMDNMKDAKVRDYSDPTQDYGDTSKDVENLDLPPLRERKSISAEKYILPEERVRIKQ